MILIKIIYQGYRLQLCNGKTQLKSLIIIESRRKGHMDLPEANIFLVDIKSGTVFATGSFEVSYYTSYNLSGNELMKIHNHLNARSLILVGANRLQQSKRAANHSIYPASFIWTIKGKLMPKNSHTASIDN